MRFRLDSFAVTVPPPILSVFLRLTRSLTRPVPLVPGLVLYARRLFPLPFATGGEVYVTQRNGNRTGGRGEWRGITRRPEKRGSRNPARSTFDRRFLLLFREPFNLVWLIVVCL